MDQPKLNVSSAGMVCCAVYLFNALTVATDSRSSLSAHSFMALPLMLETFSFWAMSCLILWTLFTVPVLIAGGLTKAYFSFTLNCFLMTGVSFFVGLATSSSAGPTVLTHIFGSWIVGLYAALYMTPKSYRILASVYFNLYALVMMVAIFARMRN